MGVVRTIGIAKWPIQGKWLDKRVAVCFNYDTDETIDGTIIRDDMEQPYETLIRMDNGRVVRSCECQFTLKEEPKS